MASHTALLLPSLLLIFLFNIITLTEGRDILIGGKSNGWKIPSSESDSLNKWAQASRFQIGDSLVWNYDQSKDSVLQVSKKDYETCNTSNPLAAFKDGNTKVKLERSGAYYFISGAEGHCEEGQKLIIVVLSSRPGRFIAMSPAPSPVEFEGPAAAAVAPTSDSATLRGGLVVIYLLGFVAILLF
ncbi:putative Early nodulin-like protein 15 [Tripterygium wilfordii]|uniref:Putative Early nodulin-like protein 15 n=1 Tax=Tripterygium wilfordii TaxID=458696 RepID=A0A7J7DT12_TRIWF|nr:early nodulin-like protein 1 [Tripterygium wilfordii]KAF5749508.1 putative Early nodulin-like protein 15 [Tripterygium wilfordii]